MWWCWVGVALAVAAAGCGGSGTREAAPATREDAMLDYARCMREHGVPMADPRPGAGVILHVRRGSREKLQKAEKACRPLMRGAFEEPTPEERERLRDAALAFARCMREHGVDMPDPQFSGDDDDFELRAAGVARGPRDDRDFRAASRACGRLLPRPAPEAP